MSLILNIETATNICSVALAKHGKLISLKESKQDKSHAELLTVFIENILNTYKLKASSLDAVAVSKGPGSYTGLRIGVSTAKGICYGINKPLIGICTLQAMAYGVCGACVSRFKTVARIKRIKQNSWFCPMIDARRQEVYSAFFDNKNQLKREVSADIIETNSYKDILDERKVIFFGNGSEKCKNILKSKNAFFIDNISPSAKNMLVLSEKAFNNKKFEDTAYFEPFYLKDFVAIPPKKNIFGISKAGL